jgi:hypothetical protein
MPRKSRRGQQRERMAYVWAGLASVVSVAVLGAFAYFFVQREKPLDAKTLCPADGPRGHYVLLVDKTDPLSFTQRQAFTVMLKELVDRRVPQGFLLSVFVLGEDFKATADPLVELCNPGSGADKSEWTANLKKAHAQYQSRFIDPVIAQADALTASKSANASPIFEMLQLVGINAFRKHAVDGDRKLVLVSDMLHNTPQFSMFKSTTNPEYEAFAATDYGRRMHCELDRVAVEIHYLMHTPALQTKRNLQFWMDYFNHSGARVVAVRPM